MRHGSFPAQARGPTRCGTNSTTSRTMRQPFAGASAASWQATGPDWLICDVSVHRPFGDMSQPAASWCCWLGLRSRDMPEVKQSHLGPFLTRRRVICPTCRRRFARGCDAARSACLGTTPTPTRVSSNWRLSSSEARKYRRCPIRSSSSTVAPVNLSPSIPTIRPGIPTPEAVI